MRKEPEPLNELLQQQFPKTDPIELEQMTKTVEKWLQQKLKFCEKSIKQVAKQFGEHAQQTIITKTYARCIENLLNEIDPQNCPIHT